MTMMELDLLILTIGAGVICAMIGGIFIYIKINNWLWKKDTIQFWERYRQVEKQNCKAFQRKLQELRSDR